jgi:hypothetical protein
MSVYITQFKKDVWGLKVHQLKKQRDSIEVDDFNQFNILSTEINIYENLLSEAIMLPVEESWGKCKFNGAKIYPNGVIIKQQS